LKNRLTDPDARVAEQAFASRIAALNAANDAPTAVPLGAALGYQAIASVGSDSLSELVTERSPLAESRLLLGAPPRRRDKAHLKYVAKQACLVCGRQPSDPHHLRFAQPPVLGRKVSDEFTVPLCRSHHRELHRSSNEAGWWKGLNIEPLAIAIQLWKRTRPNNSSNDAAAVARLPSNNGKVGGRLRLSRATRDQKSSHDLAKTS
jgi:hypothetical protein